jgi:acetyl esterase/lipase
VAALMARDEGIPLLGQVLTWPSVCHPKFMPKDEYEMGSYLQNHNASVVTTTRMEWFLDQYMPEPTNDWRMSPLLAPSLKGLPPTRKSPVHSLNIVLGRIALPLLTRDATAVITVAGYDILRDEGLAYAKRLQDEGVQVELKVYKGLPHCAYFLVPHPEAIEYYERVTAFVKKLSG